MRSGSQHWTTSDIPDLNGNVMIVTGANTGIGYEAAKELAGKGAHVVMACRSVERGQAALEAVRVAHPEASAEVMQLDLSDLDSVRAFAAAFQAKHDRLDVLANNAGIMMVPYGKTDDGFESQFGVNHLGHFALTGLLLESLVSTPGSRVVNVSSAGHRMGTMDFDNLMWEAGDYSAPRAYGRSKLANLLFTYELQRRFDLEGLEVLALAAHPGSSDTELGRHLEDRWYYKLASPVVGLLAQSAAMGALPTLRAAVDPSAKPASYYGPGGFMEQRGHPIIVKSNAASHDEAAAKQLWERSEELTGVHYDLSAAARRTNPSVSA